MSWRAEQEKNWKPPSALTDAEKEFLKVAKKLRDILKLEDKKNKGEPLDKTQEQKLSTRDALLKDVVAVAAKLPKQTEQLQKNPDIFELLPEDLRMKFESKREKEVDAQKQDEQRRARREEKEREERSKAVFMPQHNRPIVNVVCNGNGYIYTCAKDKFIIGWNMEKKLLAATATFAGHEGAVWGLDISAPDAGLPNQLISGGADGKVMFWNGDAVKKRPSDETIVSPQRTLDHGGVVYVLRWCPFEDSSAKTQRFASANAQLASTPAAICVWEVAARGPPKQLVKIEKLPGCKANDLRWHGGSLAKLISAHDNGYVGIWNATSGDLLKTLDLHKGPVSSLVLKDNLLITSSHDKSSKVVDIAQKQCDTVATYTLDRPCRAVVVTPDFVPSEAGHIILAGGRDPKEVTTSKLQENEFQASIKDSASQEEMAVGTGHFGPIHVMLYMSWLNKKAGGFATTSEDGYFRIHGMDGELLHSSMNDGNDSCQ